MNFDSRITPARPDLAADFLKDKVTADKFVAGTPMCVGRGRACLHHAPRHDSGRDSELLFGEIFTVYEQKNGWCWGQAQRDNYVGYVRESALAMPQDHGPADAMVTAPMTALLPAPDVKSFATDMLPLNARVKVEEREGSFARLRCGGFVAMAALRPLAKPDWVAVAERFAGVPYLWGGRTFAGLDCSALIQTAMQAAGAAIPRDTDMQEEFFTLYAEAPQRGDLVFWKGHVGVMLDATRLLHANVHHMMVAAEPLAEAEARIEKIAGLVTSIKRPL